jgi:hypothetical protein
VDNSGTDGPYVLVSSVFEGGAYRVQPGQRVMFQHGSLREVVDEEKESCGCPPAAAKGNEFPIAQSEGLAPLPKPAAGAAGETAATSVPVGPLVYKSTDHATEPVALPTAPTVATADAEAAAPKPANKPKAGFFGKIGHFFRRIFGAE